MCNFNTQNMQVIGPDYVVIDINDDIIDEPVKIPFFKKQSFWFMATILFVIAIAASLYFTLFNEKNNLYLVNENIWVDFYPNTIVNGSSGMCFSFQEKQSL